MGNCQNTAATSDERPVGYDKVKSEATPSKVSGAVANSSDGNKSGSHSVEPSQTDLTVADSCASSVNPAQPGNSVASKDSIDDNESNEENGDDYLQFDPNDEELPLVVSTTRTVLSSAPESTESEPSKEEERKEQEDEEEVEDLAVIPSSLSPPKAYHMAIKAPPQPESPRYLKAFPVEKGKPLVLGYTDATAKISTKQSDVDAGAIVKPDQRNVKCQWAIPVKEVQSTELVHVPNEHAVTNSESKMTSSWALSPREVSKARAVVVSTSEKSQWSIKNDAKQHNNVSSQPILRERRSRKKDQGEKYPNGVGYPPNFPPL